MLPGNADSPVPVWLARALVWRLAQACWRLVYIAAPVAGVAEELVFADPAYFSRFFKRRMGMNPHRWRRLQLGAGVEASASAAG